MGGYFKNKLTDLECKKSKCPIDKNFIYLADGFGLRLRVKKNSKAWIYRFRLDHKWHQMGFGVYPTVTLIDARNKREIAAKEVSKGLHPKFYFDNDKLQNIKKSTERFKFSWVFTDMLNFNANPSKVEKPWSISHIKRYKGLYKNYLKPQGIDNKNLSEFSDDRIIELLQFVLDNPYEKVSGKVNTTLYPRRKTMGYVKTLLNMVFKHAKDILRYKGTNPVTELKGNILFKGLYKTSQFKSVDIDEVGKYWSQIKNIRDFQDRVFLMINVVTALRVGSQIKLKWNMFDRFKKEIIISKELMKNRESFITPIPEFLVSLLSKLKDINKPETDDEYIFKGRDKGSHYQNNRPRLLIKKLGFNVTAHGNRTLFKDINEIEGRSTISIELQLSHSQGSKNSVENAYIKSKNYILYRRSLLENYFDYLENKATNFVSLKKIIHQNQE